MKIILHLAVLAFVAGCASSPKLTEKKVKFESDPPGARVFVAYGADERSARNRNRSFIGTTPCETAIACEGNGHFKITTTVIGYSSVVPPVAVFTAEPPSQSTNLFSRRLVFHGPCVLNSGDIVPEAVFFDLTKPEPEKK